MEEAEVYRYHYRSQGASDGLLRNMYYSIGQQLIRQDPSLYVAHVNLRQDHKPNLISYPFPVRYYRYSDDAAPVYDFSEGDVGNLQDHLALRDEVVVSGPECPVGILTGYEDAFNKWRASEGLDGNSQNLQGDEYDQLVSKVSFQDSDVEAGDVVFSRTGVVFRHAITLDGLDRLAFSTGLVKVNQDGTLENGAKYDDIVKAHRNCEVSAYPRYGGTPDVFRFEAFVSLTGCGPLSDFLVGRLGFDDNSVRIERKAWLNKDQKSIRQNYIDKWRNNAFEQVKSAWRKFQEVEKEVYGKRSYFENKAKHAVPAPDQIVIDISSESEPDKGYDKVSADERSTASKGKKRMYIPEEEESEGDGASSGGDSDVGTEDSFQ